MNFYNREYYESFDTNFRATIDYGLHFFKLSPENNYQFQSLELPGTTILELKYNQQHDDMVERVSNYFPFRMTKSSKYVSGMNLLI